MEKRLRDYMNHVFLSSQSQCHISPTCGNTLSYDSIPLLLLSSLTWCIALILTQAQQALPGTENPA